MSCDLLLIGVGGQGVLTIGGILIDAATAAGVPASLYPTKGMAQRGGSVKVELRLGRDGVGPHLPERGADVVVSMERSETLRAVRIVKPGGDVLLYDHVWEPTAVMLGDASYPALDAVAEQVGLAEAGLVTLDPTSRPRVDGVPVVANVFVLGAAVGLPALRGILEPAGVREILERRWPRAAEANAAAFDAGLRAVEDA